MEITGTIKAIFNEQVVSDKFKKREFVVTDNSSNYPQHIKMELVQDKTSLLDQYKTGDEVKVHINIRGREYVNKEGQTQYFNSIQAWRIERLGGSSNSSSSVSGNENVEGTSFSGKEDDLPF